MEDEPQWLRSAAVCRIMSLEGWRAQVSVWIIKFLVLVHDIVTIPIYFAIDQPWRRWVLNRIIWAKLEDESNPYSCYTRQVHDPTHHDIEIQTMDKLFEYSVARHGERNCFGVREVFGEEEVVLESGKVFKKFSLGIYKWMTYKEAGRKVTNIAKGLYSLGVQSETRVAMFAETRVEWMLTAQALFRMNAPLVTIYATLGDDAFTHCVNETEVKYIVTSLEQLPKVKRLLPKLPAVTHIICMEGLIPISDENLPDGVKLIPFLELEELGESVEDFSCNPPEPDDLAIIMYTSGSTGVPKGVMITHKNVLTCVDGFDAVISNKTLSQEDPDTYIAYLPSAHVLELASECLLLSVGVQVGFSSAQTLSDFSTGIKKDEKGDLKELKPTLMVAVPLMLDRIRHSILLLAGKEGSFKRLMFDFAVSYKKFWSELGFETPRLNRKLLKIYQDFMGGRLRAIFCGSAPLSSETQSFIRCCLNTQVLQGYGLTETAACATAMHPDDYSLGRVGAPLATCKLRLVDWEEGQYFVKDTPNPRGEIVIGGDCLTLGYYKLPEQTQEAFKIEGGERWFYSGDIGEVFPNGTVKIIDRKKDLVKLQFGEYIALGKVEAEMKTSPIVENICVIGAMQTPYLIALVIPNQHQLKLIAKKFGKDHLSFEEMCYDEQILQEASDKLKDHAKRSQLKGGEIPQKFRLISDEWSPESGLVTAAFKLRRKFIENHYQDIIKNMFIGS